MSDFAIQDILECGSTVTLPYPLPNGNYMASQAVLRIAPCTMLNNSSNSSTATNLVVVEVESMYAGYMQQVESMSMETIKTCIASICAVGVVSNVLLLVYIIRSHRYQSPIFAFIFSLACSDSWTCFNGMTLLTLSVPTLHGPKWLCQVYIVIAHISHGASVFHMVFFSFLRFYQLVFPLAARARITLSLIIKICIGMWVAPIGSAVFFFIVYHSHTFIYKGQTITICGFDKAYQIHMVGIHTLYLFIPMVLIAVFHLSKHCIVIKQTEKAAVTITDNEQQQRKTTDTRAVTMVIGVFCITAFPHMIHTYMHIPFGYPIQSFHQLYYTISQSLLFINSALNPFIYALCAGSVRRDIAIMLKCSKKRRNANE